MMFVRSVLLVLVLIILSACTFRVVTVAPGEYYVSPILPTSSNIPFPTPTVEMLPTLEPIYVCPTLDYVTIRAAQTTSSTELGRLLRGQRLVGITSMKDYYQVWYKGQVAYTHKSYSTLCTTGTIVQ